MTKRIWIDIQDIPHFEQRYNTCGDWTAAENGDMEIRVSFLPDRREMLLVAVHELVEAILCDHRGISTETVDKFDKGFQASDIYAEPGDHPLAPYYLEHQFATFVERRLAEELEVDWPTYERHLDELYQTYDEEKTTHQGDDESLNP